MGVQMLAECRAATAVMLLEGHTVRWDVPVMDLAIAGSSKAFVAKEHCQVLIDRRWGGDFDGSTCMLPDGLSLLQLLGEQQLSCRAKL